MAKEKPVSDAQFATLLQLQEAIVQIHRDLATIRESVAEVKGKVNGMEKRVDRHEDRITTGERFNKGIVIIAGVVALVAGFIGTWLARVFGFR